MIAIVSVLFVLAALTLAIIIRILASPRAQWWQCSWCKWYFSSEGALVPYRKLTDASDPVSHGICPNCANKLLETEKAK